MFHLAVAVRYGSSAKKLAMCCAVNFEKTIFWSLSKYSSSKDG
jgi:hypothetical protein